MLEVVFIVKVPKRQVRNNSYTFSRLQKVMLTWVKLIWIWLEAQEIHWNVDENVLIKNICPKTIN